MSSKVKIYDSVFNYLSKINYSSEKDLIIHNYGNNNDNFDYMSINLGQIKDIIDDINVNRNNIFSIQIYKVFLTDKGDYNDNDVARIIAELDENNGVLDECLNNEEKALLNENYMFYSILAINSLISEVAFFDNNLNHDEIEVYRNDNGEADVEEVGDDNEEKTPEEFREEISTIGNNIQLSTDEINEHFQNRELTPKEAFEDSFKCLARSYLEIQSIGNGYEYVARAMLGIISKKLGMRFHNNYMYNFDLNGAIQQLSLKPDKSNKIEDEFSSLMKERYLLNRIIIDSNDKKHREFILDENNPFEIYDISPFAMVRDNDDVEFLNEEELIIEAQNAAHNRNHVLDELQRQYEMGYDFDINDIRPEDGNTPGM